MICAWLGDPLRYGEVFEPGSDTRFATLTMSRRSKNVKKCHFLNSGPVDGSLHRVFDENGDFLAKIAIFPLGRAVPLAEKSIFAPPKRITG